MPCPAVPCRALPCSAVSCRAMPSLAVPCRALPCPGSHIALSCLTHTLPCSAPDSPIALLCHAESQEWDGIRTCSNIAAALSKYTEELFKVKVEALAKPDITRQDNSNDCGFYVTTCFVPHSSPHFLRSWWGQDWPSGHDRLYPARCHAWVHPCSASERGSLVGARATSEDSRWVEKGLFFFLFPVKRIHLSYICIHVYMNLVCLQVAREEQISRLCIV